MTPDLPTQLPMLSLCGDHAEATYSEIRAYGIACWNAAIAATALEIARQSFESSRLSAANVRAMTKKGE